MSKNLTALTPNSEQKTVQVAGGKLAYEVAGSGPVVLCLPGIGDTRRVYERFAPALVAAGYRVISTDLRGNGGSVGHFASHHLTDLSNDIGAILDAEGIRRAYLAGGSLSGASAGLFANRHPDRVAGLILFSPVFASPSRLLIALLIAVFRLPLLGAGLWVTYFKTLYPKQPVEAAYVAEVGANIQQPGALKSLTDMLWTRHLDSGTQAIKAPTLIFYGTKDSDFKDARVEAAGVQKAIPQAQIHILDGFGHYPQREAAEMVIPQTVEWLAAR